MISSVSLALVLAAIVLCLSLWLNLRLWRSGRQRIRSAASEIRGARIDRGLIAEQFAPFTKAFQRLGWDPQEFRFLGKPIDGIQFEDDGIVIVEFKTGNSSLSRRQRHIKELVDRGRVKFREIRF